MGSGPSTAVGSNVIDRFAFSNTGSVGANSGFPATGSPNEELLLSDGQGMMFGMNGNVGGAMDGQYSSGNSSTSSSSWALGSSGNEIPF
jgi:hypothetical protein